MESLIDGIESEARSEAEKIVSRSERVAEEIKAAVKKRVASLLREAEQKAQVQIEAIERGRASALAAEARRISLKERENTIEEILDEVEQRLASMIEKPEYREHLKHWIVEAAIGLNAPEAQINASAKELSLVDQNLLRECEKEVEELTGRKLRLKRTREAPLIPQGIVLTAADGRTSFNNQIAARLLRYQSEIKKSILEEFFDDQERPARSGECGNE